MYQNLLRRSWVELGLITYIIRRVLLLIPVLVGVSLLIFSITTLLPPTRRAVLYLPDKPKPGDIERIIQEYGLNQPVWIQYFTWLQEVLKGNLGYSMVDNMPVIKSIMVRIPATAELVLYSVPLIIFLGIRLGIISAIYRDKPPDHITRFLAITGTSLPSFWIGIVLLAIFYSYLGWFPPGRVGWEAFNYITTSKDWKYYTGILTIDSLLNGQPWIFVDAVRHLILPVTVLTSINVATLARVMRSSMLEVLNKPYITLARVKGLRESQVIDKHARRNALIPVITLSGLMTAGMLTGLTITETVFSFPGIGHWAAQAALNLDIPSVIGYALFCAIVFVIANLIVDILYAYIDPRIRLG